MTRIVKLSTLGIVALATGMYIAGHGLRASIPLLIAMGCGALINLWED